MQILFRGFTYIKSVPGIQVNGKIYTGYQLSVLLNLTAKPKTWQYKKQLAIESVHLYTAGGWVGCLSCLEWPVRLVGEVS